MNYKTNVCLQSFGCFFIAISCTFAANPSPPVLTETGKGIEKSYRDQLTKLQTEIKSLIPQISPQEQDAFKASRAAVAKATAELNVTQQAIGKVNTAKALIDHAQGKWLGGAEKGIAQAEAALKKATSDKERQAAQADLAKWQADKAAGLKALQERTAAYEQAKLEEPKSIEAHKAAQAKLAAAQADELAITTDLLQKVEPIISNNQWDAKLAQGAILANATPAGLAEFAQTGEEHRALLDKLFSSETLMKQMLEAGGAKEGKYGQAVKIYAAIRKASPKSKDGILHRLAIGVALEHAGPIAQRNAVTAANAPTVIDPVNRYLHYEQAYLNNELDPAFKDMTAWECRWIVRCDAPDHVLAWGREMLRNYRPDHVSNPDYGWCYSGMVRTDVAYRNSHLLKDTDSLEFFQNVCKEGGICGRRAFFGRFILQSFGIPSVERPQRGHAALAHWTPKGWVVNLGAGWGYPEAKGLIGLSDTDFLLETQVREHPQLHEKCLRTEWISYALEEKKYESMKPGSGDVWNILAQCGKKAIVATAKPETLAALGQELGEANESAEAKAKAVSQTIVKESDKQIVVDSQGVITVPASVWNGATLMNSFLGGQQLSSGGGTFQCTLDVPEAGKYILSARVVTVHENPNLQLIVNDNKNLIEIPVPYTIGKWEQTKPTQIVLNKGKNTLRFARPAGSHGLSMKEVTLTPVK